MPKKRTGSKRKKAKPGKVKSRKIKTGKTRPGKRKQQVEKVYMCMRCKKTFTSIRGLKRHSAEHLRDLREMKLLREGHVPEESKLGFSFKGKNKIVIS